MTTKHMPFAKRGQRVPKKILERFTIDQLELDSVKWEKVVNVFCPTGEGGGVDPTCSPGGLAGTASVRGTAGSGSAFVHEAANPAGVNTEAAYKTARGYTSERVKLHDAYIAEHLEGKTPVDRPTAYVMGGGPAVGKSTAVAQGGIVIPDNTVRIDPDEAKGSLPEYQNMVRENNPEAATFVHEESSHVAKRLQSEASKGGYNTLLDGTGDGGYDAMASKVAKMREAGQRVVAHYVTVDTDTAVRRSEERAQKTGRYVPEAVVRATHSAVSKVVARAIENKLFDELTLWDTNGGKSVKVVEARGNKLRVHDQELWARFLRKGDE